MICSANYGAIHADNSFLYQTNSPSTECLLAVSIIAIGVIYAALQRQDDILSGNTIRTATANLKMGLAVLLITSISALAPKWLISYMRTIRICLLAMLLAVIFVPAIGLSVW